MSLYYVHVLFNNCVHVDYCIQVRANGVGSKYIITDHGLSPEKTHVPSTLRKVRIQLSYSSFCYCCCL